MTNILKYTRTTDFLGGCKQGDIDLIPSKLVEAFGEGDEGDGYKVTGEFCFSNKETGHFFYIYDWKMTSNYDDYGVSPYQFWKTKHPVTFNIGGKSMPSVEVLTELRKIAGTLSKDMKKLEAIEYNDIKRAKSKDWLKKEDLFLFDKAIKAIETNTEKFEVYNIIDWFGKVSKVKTSMASYYSMEDGRYFFQSSGSIIDWSIKAVYVPKEMLYSNPTYLD